MTGTGAGLLAVVGLGALVVALARANGRRIVIVMSGGGLLALVVAAAMVGHCG